MGKEQLCARQDSGRCCRRGSCSQVSKKTHAWGLPAPPRERPLLPKFLYCEISIRKPPEMSSGVGEFAIIPSTHTESDTDDTKTYSPSKGFLRTLPSPTKAAFMRRTRVLVLGMRWMKRSSF